MRGRETQWNKGTAMRTNDALIALACGIYGATLVSQAPPPAAAAQPGGASPPAIAGQPGVAGQVPTVLMEMTLKNLSAEGKINHQDFLDRVDMLSTLGHPVLISNYGEFHRLAAYLFRYTKMPIGFVMGVPTLRELFEEIYYQELEGGILESFGRMFRNDLKLYVYPLKDAQNGAIITAGNLRVVPHLRHLYLYLTENNHIVGLRDIDERSLSVFSRDVLQLIELGGAGWEEMVPTKVSQLIKQRHLLGYKDAEPA